ncbi:MAG: hypothetical protein HOE11_03325 [Candidatus Diapherotrites archaeon]|nr:hypothetical protein [Candidatus Diapherotrites archaeon]MBT4597333.1 hypothetical protein [Candidatus Diapherotrites archaeon]
MDLKSFFAPSWKKIGWFFLVFFVAQLYLFVILPYVPTQILQGFIHFILNPATILLSGTINVNSGLSLTVINTINLAWNYFLATLLAKEISKE